jgi:hypothetical protein
MHEGIVDGPFLGFVDVGFWLAGGFCPDAINEGFSRRCEDDCGCQEMPVCCVAGELCFWLVNYKYMYLYEISHSLSLVSY